MSRSDWPLGLMVAAALLAAGWLVLPFADAMLVAAVIAVLVWPLHQRLLLRLGHRETTAAVLSVVLLTVGVIGPLIGLVWVVARELVGLALRLAAEVEGGGLSGLLQRAQELPVVSWLVEQGGGPEPVEAAIRAQVADLVGELASTVGQSVPALVGQTAHVLLAITVFLLTLGSLLMHGERLLAWAERLSPLPAAHTARLVELSAGFARNVVLAGLVATLVQGLVAGVGYGIVGVERPVLWALLTGVLAYVPLVGTAVAWVPITLLLLLEGRPGAALFVAIWSILLTGTVDNLVKPLVVRGRTDVPAVLVFLGVFGGLATMGLVGLLVGPIVMAMVLALVRLYAESQQERAAPEPALLNPPPPR